MTSIVPEQEAHALARSVAGRSWVGARRLSPTQALVVWTIVASVALAGSLEGLARWSAVQAWLPPPSVGSRSLQFDVQLDRLERFAAGGGVDCLFIGSSIVHLGINPTVVSQTYNEATGRPLRCFNFGVWGMDAATAGVLGPLLVEAYDVPILIYTTAARDYLPDPEAAKLLDNPWVSNRSGRATPATWLVEHSVALRTLGALVNRVHVDNQWVQKVMDVDRYTQTDGYYRETGLGNVSTPPDLSSPEEQLYVWMLSDYAVHPAALAGLEQLVALQATGRQVLLVEAPMHPSILSFLPQGEEDYQAFSDQAQAIGERAGVPLLWGGTLPQRIPDAGWSDRFHLNTVGADQFSAQVGAWLVGVLE